MATPLPLPQSPETVITAEAGMTQGAAGFRVEPLVQAGDLVAQGQPLLRDRRRPECVLTAPMAGRITELEIGAGRRLTSLVVRAEGDARHGYDTASAGQDDAGLRRLLQDSGLWMRLRTRPYDNAPGASGSPVSIFVMAVDTRPLAPDPRLGLEIGHLQAGLRALARLTDGPIHLCQDRGPDIVPAGERLRIVKVGPAHPSGLAGHQILRRFPAGPGREVWDIQAEDVAAIGHLLATGHLPATRLVSVTGPGLRESRLLRCQPGADLRELCHAHMTPGPRVILSGSAVDGRESRWLRFRDRQVTVLERSAAAGARHWLQAALRMASRPEPLIATAAVEEAMGGAMPGALLLRALAVGDDEAAADLGALSLLEEDLALADYVTDANPRFADLLRAALDRIEANA